MAETLSYQGIRNANVAREADEQRTETRRKNLLILVLHFLNEEGYIESAQTLSRETSIDLNRYEVCDNVDLPTVLMEYESYYYIKFSKYPKITKKLPPNEVATNRFRNNKLRRLHQHMAHKFDSPRLATQQKPPTPPSNNTRPKSAIKKSQKDPKQVSSAVAGGNLGGQGDTPLEALALHGLVVHGSSGTSETGQQAAAKEKPKRGQIIDVRAMISEATKLSDDVQSTAEDRLLKPLGGM
ncbi:Katanin p60 ATPase-containing subunit A-like 2 [Lamellibrachia satsuma]|nr:Katanin p60 ATPase-containing subunit A-like 2 [Lamellibrachia satsuma]